MAPGWRSGVISELKLEYLYGPKSEVSGSDTIKGKGSYIVLIETCSFKGHHHGYLTQNLTNSGLHNYRAYHWQRSCIVTPKQSVSYT